ncbi:MAG: TAXI family TRAP transporter solute-binding subunit [Spirochaetota bacterium]
MKATFNMTHKVLIVLLALMFAAGTVFAGGDSEETDAAPSGPVRLNMGGGWVTGVYFPMAGAMSRIVHTQMEDVSLTVESSGASVVNANLIRSGDLDMAIVQNDVAYYAYNGTGVEAFEGNEVPNMRGLFTMYPEPVQLIARADSEISSPADLAGRRVAIGPLGSGAEVNALEVLEVAGLTEDDLDGVERLAASEAADFLRDGRVDAAFFTVAAGGAVIADLAVSQDIVVVPITGEYADALVDLRPFYATTTIPEGTYNNVPEAETVAVLAMVVANEGMSADLVYDFMSVVFENTDTLESAHAAGRMVTLESALDGMPIPLHPGAERFFEEQGME